MTPPLRDGLCPVTSPHCTRAFLDRVVPRDVLAEVRLAAGYGDVLRLKLGIDADRLVASTPAVGYADEEAAPVNRFVPRRAGMEEYVQWRN
ncbi:hypothetical protein ACFU8Q_32405 [Streptomyces sp. NPDC057543]|uniref:hypothetical protein n=1 Tax=Streptomyces sp. NPDC057543 TaxID=3346163 RepID=UPI0036BACD55